jgi:hypothetical protein
MARTMGIQLDPNMPAVARLPDISRIATNKASELIQLNHTRNHITFDTLGRHNHILHHTLAALAAGADADLLQKQYDRNAKYQRPLPHIDEVIVSSFANEEAFIAALAKVDQYSNFLAFFERQLSSSSVTDVLNKYVFAENDVARTVFNRLFSGAFHPFIHLGYGIEFSLPAIVAEGLASACTHSGRYDAYLHLCAQKAEVAVPASMVSLLKMMQDDQAMSSAANLEDAPFLADGVLSRVSDELTSCAAQWKVRRPLTPDNLEEAAAELINSAVYMACAAQRPPKIVKLDFYFMHAVTSSLFLTVFLRAERISLEAKAKIIEWKGRLDLLLYASVRCPDLIHDEIRPKPQDEHQPRSWEDLLRMANEIEDDGHTVKFIRAIRNGEQVCGKYTDHAEGTEGEVHDETRRDWQIHGNMWRHLAMMVVDSVQPGKGDRWLRGAGFPQAWEKYPVRTL